MQHRCRDGSRDGRCDIASDIDRFRRHERDALAEQPGHVDGAHSAFDPEQAGGPSPAAPPQYAPPHTAAPGPSYGAPYGSAPQWAPPRYTTPHYAAGFDGRDAPLIHPAAAQASSITPYGVPVYRAPVVPIAVQPARGLSVTALVLGLCSFVFAWIFVVVPILGIVFGILAMRREPAGRTMAIIGLVGSAVGLVWVLLVYLLPLVTFITAMVLTATV